VDEELERLVVEFPGDPLPLFLLDFEQQLGRADAGRRPAGRRSRLPVRALGLVRAGRSLWPG
jgi:hypothetical protein